MKKTENNAYVRVYRYNYQNRIGIIGLNRETMERLFPIPNIKGIGGPFFFELSAKPIKEEDIPKEKPDIKCVRIEYYTK